MHRFGGQLKHVFREWGAFLSGKPPSEGYGPASGEGNTPAPPQEDLVGEGLWGGYKGSDGSMSNPWKQYPGEVKPRGWNIREGYTKDE